MKDDSAPILDDLLCRWHAWSQRSHGVGYPPKNPACRLYRASRQYDDTNGALDADLDDAIMAAVDAAIDTLQPLHQSVIHNHARNLATGYAVWSNPRLPTNPNQRAALVSDARASLARAIGGLLTA